MFNFDGRDVVMALVEKMQNVIFYPDVPKSKDIKMPQTLKRKMESWSCCQVNLESSAIGVRWKHTKCKKSSILTKHVKTPDRPPAQYFKMQVAWPSDCEKVRITYSYVSRGRVRLVRFCRASCRHFCLCTPAISFLSLLLVEIVPTLTPSLI